MVFIAELFWWFENVKPDFVQPRDTQESKEGKLGHFLGLFLFIKITFLRIKLYIDPPKWKSINKEITFWHQALQMVTFLILLHLRKKESCVLSNPFLFCISSFACSTVSRFMASYWFSWQRTDLDGLGMWTLLNSWHTPGASCDFNDLGPKE